MSANNNPLSSAAVAFLETRGLDVDLCERLGIASAKSQSGSDVIVFPYERGGVVVNKKFRKVASKEFHQVGGGEQIFWRVDCLADPGLADEPLIITEGEMDAVVAIQAGFWRTVSMPGGAPAEASKSEEDLRASARYAPLRQAAIELDAVKVIILAVDSDAAGVALRSDLSSLLHPARCKFVTYPPGCKDLNDVLKAHGIDAVRDVLNGARWMNVAGVLEPDELPELAPLTVWRPEVFKPIDDLLAICPGHVSVWTGLAGDGKSTLVNAAMWSLADRYGLRLAAAPFESTPQREYFEDLVAYRSGRAVDDARDPATEQDKEDARVWWRKHIVFLYGDGYAEPGSHELINATIEWFLTAAETAVRRFGCKIVVLDPWSQIDHEPSSFEREDQYVRRVLKACKRFARIMDVHVAIVAHPAKPKRNPDGTYPVPEGYDISGAAHWKNAPDLGVTVYRDPPTIEDPDNPGKMIPDPKSTRVLIKAWKVKFHRKMNRPGECYARVDMRTGRYHSAEHWEDRTFPKKYPEPRQDDRHDD